jgi:hypothetical protein
LFLDVPLDPVQFSEGVVAHGGIYVLFMEIRQSITASYMENERKFDVYSILKISQQNQMTNVRNAERILEHHQDNYRKFVEIANVQRKTTKPPPHQRVLLILS